VSEIDPKQPAPLSCYNCIKKWIAFVSSLSVTIKSFLWLRLLTIA
jgi:hypothetical protein